MDAPSEEPNEGPSRESSERRSERTGELPLRYAGFEIHPGERRLVVHGQFVTLRAKAYDLLLVLAARSDRVVGKAELLDLVWPGLVVEENNLAVQISTLRKVLGAGVIATIPGQGYRFTAARVAGSPPDQRAVAMAAGTAGAPVTEPAAATGVAAEAAAGIAAARAPTLAAAGNLPLDTDPLLGRDDEVAALLELLHSHRLVSLVGAGGLGKTRLARAVAHQLQPDLAGGSWWVDLAALLRHDHVARAVAQGVAAPLGEGDAAALLARVLAARPPLLLVLDNCEQVAAGVAEVIAAVLAGAPAVRVLATSQQPLHLADEQVWRLDALAVPEPGMSLHDARRHAAFALFERRAHACDQHFRLTGAAVEQAITLCRHLGGHALAIEMAAARVPQIGLTTLLEQLGGRLDLLRSNQHQRPARQQSLRATLDWSCSLLDPQQRSVLLRLGVFVGSFGLAPAQIVAADAGVDTWQVLDAMVTLVERGLVQVEQLDPPRYRLAETTRLYALQGLVAAGASAGVAVRHGQALASLAREAVDAFGRTPRDAWLARHAGEHDDLLLAFDQACSRDDAPVAAETGRMLALLDRSRGIVAGARERVEQLRRLLPLAREAQVRALLDALIAPQGSISVPEPAQPDGFKKFSYRAPPV